MASFTIPSGSAAVPIVAPTAEKIISKNNSNKNSANSSSKVRTCRNLIIHGNCKYEGKGCEFNHDLNKPSTTSPPPSPETPKSKLSVHSPVFKPSGNISSISPEVINAPPFIPKQSQVASSEGPKSENGSSDQQQFYDRDDQQHASMFDQQMNYFPAQTTPNYLMSTRDITNNTFNALAGSIASLSLNASNYSVSASSSRSQPSSHNTSNASYFSQLSQVDSLFYQNQSGLLPAPLQYHLYTSPLPHISNLHPHQKTIHAFFMSDNLREDLQRKNEATLQTVNAQDYNLPEEIHVYHSLYPLESLSESLGKVFGYPTSVYKSVCTVDGRVYCLRRIEGYRLTNEIAMSTIENWRRIRHANVVSIREAFTTKAFGDHSLVFVYDYHPLSQTLFNKHFSPQSQMHPSSVNGLAIPEKLVWSYICQIAAAIKTIHSSGLAVRTIEPTKILLTSKNRIRLNCCGIMDLLTYDGGKNLPHYQQEDLLSFGQLLVSLACHPHASNHNLQKSIDFISRQYSPDLKNVILYLLSNPSPVKSIDDVVAMIGPRLLHEINSAHNYNDFLESELSHELENGRLVRLLCKFGFINERPEFDMDPSWSETGDRYLIKLFRDYVFHQVDKNGYPVVDMSHVLMCLNKLDSGVDEKIMLVSRDEQSCLIVSYREIKNCIDSAFRDLSRRK
ncbi:2113_t:CDS:10 [Paraglomus brasilianum]|uniref:PAN2-PAN3 deadenylation complex subunit PAN3 n=1 Tax=Paraglomus brasilianum TaxID=144538 RepID=A0A9N9AMR7_9GLOM|nr:2113_t:CDS:10 [Paraglomus brasilianum]